LFDQITKRLGVKETETGLAPSSQWDLNGDEQATKMFQPLIVARCLKIFQTPPDPTMQLLQGDKQQRGQPPAEEIVPTTKYIVNLRFQLLLLVILWNLPSLFCSVGMRNLSSVLGMTSLQKILKKICELGVIA
jgi:hypothetical protein